MDSEKTPMDMVMGSPLKATKWDLQLGPFRVGWPELQGSCWKIWSTPCHHTWGCLFIKRPGWHWEAWGKLQGALLAPPDRACKHYSYPPEVASPLRQIYWGKWLQRLGKIVEWGNGGCQQEFKRYQVKAIQENQPVGKFERLSHQTMGRIWSSCDYEEKQRATILQPLQRNWPW